RIPVRFAGRRHARRTGVKAHPQPLDKRRVDGSNPSGSPRSDINCRPIARSMDNSLGGISMLRFNLPMRSALVLLVAGSVALGMTLTAKPAFADNEKHERHKGRDQDRDRQSAAPGVRVDVNVRIGEPDRVIIRDYYGTETRSGRCPPGLAKKNNGCMPPGQAKKWRQGERLPREVVFHELPPRL